MQKLSLMKQVAVVRLYLGGLPYDEIAAQAEVSKGTVANVIAEFKAGGTLEVQEPVEQLDLLRGLATDLRRLKLTPAQAVIGTAIVSHLQELGVEPSEIERFAAMCHRLAGETEAEIFVRAALYLYQLEEHTGLTTEVLEEKAHGLQAEVARLEPLAKEVGQCQQQLKKLEKQQQGLRNEVSRLEKQAEPLRNDIVQKEKRAADLSRHVSDLEQRAQAADERLAVARGELQALAGLGLSSEDLRGLVQRVAGVAQRHGIRPGALRDRLLHELEELDAGLGLESHLKLKQGEL